MGRPSSYKTKQSEAILMYIASLGDDFTTASRIVTHFRGQGANIALTTVYRHLDRFVDRGRLRRFTVEGVPGACFQYIGRDIACQEKFRLQCSSCGKVLDLQCTLADEFVNHVGQAHDFHIESPQTVLQGICRDCRQKAE